VTPFLRHALLRLWSFLRSPTVTQLPYSLLEFESSSVQQLARRFDFKGGGAEDAHKVATTIANSGQLRRVALRIYRTVFSALSGMRLLACLIVAPRQGYDEPGFLSYTKSGRSVR
jgi:hypothetical protein